MAGYILVQGESITLQDLRSLVAKAGAMRIPADRSLLIGVEDGHVTLAFPVDISRKKLAPGKIPARAAYMKPAKRTRR